MEYKHLERIQRLMSTKSTSEFGVGQSTKLIKDNFEDGSGYLAKIKDECGNPTSWAANVYCMDCKHSKIMLKITVDKLITDWFKRDNKRKHIYALRLSEIAVSRVFDGKCKAVSTCAAILSLSDAAYHETWHKYVLDAEQVIMQWLCDANYVAGSYKKDEENFKIVLAESE